MTRIARTARRVTTLTVGIVLTLSTLSMGQSISGAPDRADGIYEVGKPATWQLTVKGDATALTSVAYRVKKNLMTVVKEGQIDLSAGSGAVEAALEEPGTLVVEVKAKPDAEKYGIVAGAIVAPDQIQPSAPRPADFDSFWQEKIAALGAIPMNAVVEPADSGKPSVEYAKVRLDNINGTYVYGQLAKPKRNGKFPAMLIVQYAGVYGLGKGNVVPRAEQGYLALNIMAHDLPFDQPADFYKKANETTQKNYTSIGNTDREQSYFLRMYLSCYRAADYLTTREDWDGTTLVVQGGSQGGQQALVTAGLHPRVTAALANVPAGCDATGPLAGRAAGFPYWQGWGKEPNREAIEVGRYFDVVNFAPRITAPVLVGYGLLDTTCPAVGIAAALNQIKGTKETIVLVNAGHQNAADSQKPYYTRSEAWMNALAQGKPLPLAE